MARYSGRAGSIVLNSVTWVATEWEIEETSTNVEAPAMGDIATERIHLRKDYTGRISGLLATGEPLTAALIPVGTDVAFSLRLLSTSGSPFITDTGLVTRGRITCPVSGPVTLQAEFASSDGSASFNLDTTP